MSNFDPSSANESDLVDCSPEMIAHQLFTKEPKDPCSHQIIAYDSGSDLTYIFEILITILLEGLNILTGGLTDADLSGFNQEHIIGLNPWFNSLGFKIIVTTKNEKDKDDTSKRRIF